MSAFDEKRRLKRFLYSWPALLFLVGMVGWLASGVWGIYAKERLTRATLESRQEELAEVEGRERELATSINELKTPRGVEKELREKFEVARPGEGVLVIVEGPPHERDEGASSFGIWGNIRHFFGF